MEKHGPRVVPATTKNLNSVLEKFSTESAATLPQDELTKEEREELLLLLGRAREQLHELEESDSDLGASPEDEVAARLQAWVNRNAEHRAQLDGLTEEIQFDERDLRWGLSLLNWLRGLRKYPIKRPGGPPEELPSKARIAIVGDWGSGLYAAPDIGQKIAADGYDVALHLGDVYYAGTETEIKERFLAYWPKPPAVKVSRALNSNHEMYSGGYGYFKLTLTALDQPSSYFAMRNERFLLVALDTGYKDFDLDDEQLEWVQATIAQAGPRKVIFFSHHQPFEPKKDSLTKLGKRLTPLLRSGKVFAWYWGHEHAAIVFDKHVPWNLHGRCIGHGGFPYFRYKGNEPRETGLGGAQWRIIPAKGQTPAARYLDDPNPYVPSKANPDKYGAQGYASLELDGEKLIERILRPTGEVIFQQELT